LERGALRGILHDTCRSTPGAIGAGEETRATRDMASPRTDTQVERGKRPLRRLAAGGRARTVSRAADSQASMRRKRCGVAVSLEVPGILSHDTRRDWSLECFLAAWVRDMDVDEPWVAGGRWGRAPACPDEPLSGGLPRLRKSAGPLLASQRPKQGRPEPCPWPAALAARLPPRLCRAPLAAWRGGMWRGPGEVRRAIAARGLRRRRFQGPGHRVRLGFAVAKAPRKLLASRVD
jgi:hypothetical protein